MSENKYLNKKIKRDENSKKEEMDQNEEENNYEMAEDNIIIGIIKVEKNNKKVRLINSKKENEEEIKNCEIYINDKKINFDYFYKFQNEGIYKIKYVFKNLLNSTSYMFSICNSLISLDLSKFNTQNINDMTYMFFNCSSLIKKNNI